MGDRQEDVQSRTEISLLPVQTYLITNPYQTTKKCFLVPIFRFFVSLEVYFPGFANI